MRFDTRKGMLNPRIIRRLSLTAALAGMAGCGDKATEASTSIDLAAALNQSASGDVSSYAGARSALGVPGVSVPSFDPAQCPYTASDQSFTCPTLSQNGLSYNLKYFLYDAGGQALTQVNPLTAASVRTVLDISGTVATPQGSMAISRHSDMRLAGLLSATRTLNGTSRDRDTITTTSGSSTVKTTLDATNTTANLVLPASSSNPYPASGTITTDLIGASAFGGSLSSSGTLHSVITFNGTKMATLAFSTGLGVTTCQIDLSGASSPKC